MSPHSAGFGKVDLYRSDQIGSSEGSGVKRSSTEGTPTTSSLQLTSIAREEESSGSAYNQKVLNSSLEFVVYPTA
jgi:hypothetical protein